DPQYDAGDAADRTEARSVPRPALERRGTGRPSRAGGGSRTPGCRGRGRRRDRSAAGMRRSGRVAARPRVVRGLAQPRARTLPTRSPAEPAAARGEDRAWSRADPGGVPHRLPRRREGAEGGARLVLRLRCNPYSAGSRASPARARRYRLRSFQCGVDATLHALSDVAGRKRPRPLAGRCSAGHPAACRRSSAPSRALGRTLARRGGTAMNGPERLTASEAVARLTAGTLTAE